MNLLHRFSRRLRALFRRDAVEREMAEEMRFHLEARAADRREDGLPPDEARAAAERRFGNVASLQEQAREGRGWRGLENFGHDLRLGARTLLKSPGFTFLAILTLGLGIGANTAMFTTLNELMLRPLPYPDSADLDRIDRATAQNPEGRVSPADFLDLQREMSGYGEISAYTGEDTSLAEPGQPADMVRSIRATVNFFGTLGTPPELGRDFRPGEDLPGNDRVVILSQRCWQNRFAARPDIVGRTVRVDGEPHVIVGVLPASYNDGRHLGSCELFRPLALGRPPAANRQDTMLRLIGRRAPGLTRAEAATFIANFGARLAADFPAVNAGSTWRTIPLNRTVVDASGPIILTMLVGLSGFVLLIACSNLANLLLARTIARAREFAVRAALGASRTQLLRPLIAESLLLAGAGGGVAVLIARWAMDYLSVRSVNDNGGRMVFNFDWHVFGWALAVSLVTAVAFGLAPALFALRLNLNATLKNGGRGATGSRGQQSFRLALIVGQFALAMVLLSGAALFVRGLNELNHRRAGWTSEHLVSGTVVLPPAGYPDAEKINAFHHLLTERLAALPGVASVSVSTFTPFFLWPDVRRYLVAGRDRPEPGHEPAAVVNRVGPGYFDTVGTRVLAGRAFTGRDTAASPRVVIISQTAATALFGNESPLGRRVAQVGRDDPEWSEIVGIAADVKPAAADLGAVTWQLYRPMAQEPGARAEIVVRTTGVAAGAVIDGIRATITGLDPDLPVRGLQPADAAIARSNYQLAVLRDMLGTFAFLGLGLATLGIYGVIARTMAQRTGEFAIRLVLGASLRDLTRLVLASGVKLALAGAALGLLGAVGLTRILSAGFPAMHLESPLVLVGTTLVLVAVALVACWLPSRRAAKVDPLVALRAE